MSYTKGPWTLETVRTQSGICHKIGPFPSKTDKPRHACLYADYPSSFHPADQELEDNAHLIEAAPDLLEALEMCLFQLGQEIMPSSESQEAINSALAAIAKAKGEQP